MAIGVASWILILHDFRSGGAGDEAELLFQCALGAVGGSLGAAIGKARKRSVDFGLNGSETETASGKSQYASKTDDAEPRVLSERKEAEK